MTLPRQKATLSDTGIIFISPIVGITNSLMDTLKPFEDLGIPVVEIDIFGDYEEKTFWKILKLTALPGSHSRRISFANSFPEHRVFDKIKKGADYLISKGRKNIVLGGMSGGFIFASRIAQEIPDNEIRNHEVQQIKNYVIGVFGISPLIFYPQGVFRQDTRLDHIPPRVRALLFFGDRDEIIPRGTIEYAEAASEIYHYIHVKVLKGSDFGDKVGSIHHQFFGGRDFVGPLKNVFWHPQAEKATLKMIIKFLEDISSSRQNIV